MNIEDLTLKQLKEIALMFPQLNIEQPQQPPSMFVGK